LLLLMWLTWHQVRSRRPPHAQRRYARTGDGKSDGKNSEHEKNVNLNGTIQKGSRLRFTSGKKEKRTKLNDDKMRIKESEHKTIK
jgi:hypothetical protein